jgi:starch synthase
MRVLFTASEVYPLVKTGGLADVAGALPEALARAGIDVRVLLPGYPEALDKAEDKQVIGSLGDPLAIGAEVRLIAARMPGSGLPLRLVDCPALYDRKGGPYQDADGSDYPDNALRFGVLSWVAAQLSLGCESGGWTPEVLHANDWQTGLAAAYLDHWQVEARPGTAFTIHNIAYQGRFSSDTVTRVGLDWSMYHMGGLEFWGSMSFLKAGLQYSDRITTVSRRYASEIQTAPFGCGFEGLLKHRAADLVGILNGADYAVWNPADDAHLDVRFGPHDFEAGKAANKKALQERLGLEVKADKPLLVIVSRLTDQKSADVVLSALPSILRQGAQLAVLGTGDHGLEDAFRAAARSNPRQVAVEIGYSEGTAHRLMAAGDMLLLPSRFEPCGLTQFYAFRYGTVPVAHFVGGLADTIVDTTYDALLSGTATGFVFDHANAGALQWTLERAIALYRRRDDWRRVQVAGFAQDFGWHRSAERYIDLYRTLARQ